MWQLHIGSHSGPSWSASFRFVPVQPLLTCKNIHAAAREKKQSQQAHFTIYSTKKASLQDAMMVVLSHHNPMMPKQSFCSLFIVGHSNWADICMVVESSSGAACMQRGCGIVSTSKVVPYHTKKLAMWHKLVSNQRIFKMCARKRAFSLIKTFIP